jgi:fucose permease
MNAKMIPILMIFICMGMIDSTGPMVSLAMESFRISNTMAALLPLVGYLMFGLLSVPIGLLQDKKGKKFILNLGLAVALSGLLIPIFSGLYGNMHIDRTSHAQFYTILSAILLLGAGASTLQVSGNPIVRDVSREGHYSKNLSLAQSFITVGSSLGFLLPVIMLHSFQLDWSVIFPFFSGIVLISLIWLNTLRIEEKQNSQDHHATLRSCLKLLKNGYVLLMVMGIFIYCGVEIAVSAHVPILLKEKFSISVERYGILISWLLFYLPILSGRVLGSMILSKMRPVRLYVITVIVAAAGLALVFTGSFVLTLTGIFLAGLGFANIFPLTFSITIESMPGHTNELSGLMVSAIAGGAFIPLAMGVVADNLSITAAFLVPVLCIVYLSTVAAINYIKLR